MVRNPQGGHNALTIKAHNLHRLLLALLRCQPISRVRLARLTGLSTTTVTNLTGELIGQGVLAEVGTDLEAVTEGAGRPPLAMALIPDSRYAVGIHIGVRTLYFALGDLAAHLIDQRTLPHRPAEPVDQTLDRMAATVNEMLAAHPETAAQVVGVGVGASGLVEQSTGINILAPNLGWRNVPLRDELARRLHLPVQVDNNVRCMALAESLFGQGKHAKALAFVYSRVGLGAGLVVDGQVYRGAGYGAGEIGHWTILPQGGELCRCGNTGCLETLVSEPAIIALARPLAPDVLAAAKQTGLDPLSAIFAAARAGHPALKTMLADRAFYMGIALANLVNVLNPQLIVLGGLLDSGFDLFHPVLLQTIRDRAFGGLGDQVTILPASFGDKSGEAGAVALGLDTFFFSAQAQGAGGLPAQIGKVF